MKLFIQQNKGINASNTLGAFVGFLLESRTGIKKNIVFTPLQSDKTHEFYWKAGLYKFIIFGKVYGKNDFQAYFNVEQEISSKSLQMLMTNTNSLFFM